ncbi:hypothetical protein [uncultured Actinomyces sp.]|nr:hypothetical protein [uncultured Actinomyces sp.]
MDRSCDSACTDYWLLPVAFLHAGSLTGSNTGTKLIERNFLTVFLP